MFTDSTSKATTFEITGLPHNKMIHELIFNETLLLTMKDGLQIRGNMRLLDHKITALTYVQALSFAASFCHFSVFKTTQVLFNYLYKRMDVKNIIDKAGKVHHQSRLCENKENNCKLNISKKLTF